MILAAATVLSGCAAGFQPLGQSSNQASALPTPVATSTKNPGLANSYEQAAMAIIQSSCVSCHGTTSGSAGVYNLTDLNHLVSGSLVVPGFPNQSVLYNSMITGGMPPAGALSQSQQQTISEWIQAAAPAPTATPSPIAVPSPTATPTPAASVSFANLQTTIFQPFCVSCHSSGNAAGGYAYDSYSAVKASVNLTTPTLSRVYASTTSGSMPKGGGRLSSTQEAQILQWIQNGAPNN